MKKLAPLLILVALVASGCKLRADAGITILEDESGTLALEVSLDEELRDVLSQQGQDLDLTAQLDGLPEGWTVEPFVDGEFEGVRAGTHFESFDDLVQRLTTLEDSEFGRQGNVGDLLAGLDLTRDGNRYSISVALQDVSGSFESAVGEGLGGFDTQALFESVFEVRFIATLPGEVVEHNGDALEGSTVTWNIDLAGSASTLSAVSETARSATGVAIVGVVVGAVALLGGGILLAQRRNEQRARELVAAAAADHHLEEQAP